MRAKALFSFFIKKQTELDTHNTRHISRELNHYHKKGNKVKKTNQAKQSSKAIHIIETLLLIAVILTLAYVVSTVINAYIDYRIDKYFIDNQVWYMLEECL